LNKIENRRDSRILRAGTAAAIARCEAHDQTNNSALYWRTTMNRILTALALSGLFVAAPAFAKTHVNKPVATAGDKAAAGDKASETKTTETKTEAPADASAKPAKKVKKSKKVEKTEGSSEKPAEAPAK
jgi:hypothetical protein